MIQKPHKCKEQTQYIRANERTGENSIQFEFEYRKEGNVGECVGGVDEEGEEEGDDEGV